MLLWLFCTTNVSFGAVIHISRPYGLLFKKNVDIYFFHLPFYHHLLYNNPVIQDTRLCISKCRIHLHPLLYVCENFPVTLKMYFYALPDLFPQWAEGKVDLHDYVCYLCDQVMIFHRIAVPAV